MGYALLSKWPLTWIGNLAEDAKSVAQQQGRVTFGFRDIDAAINEFRLPSDLAQTRAFEERPATRRGRQTLLAPPAAAAPPLPVEQPRSEYAQRQVAPLVPVDRARHGDLVPTT
jgi:hypothetical protein